MTPKRRTGSLTNQPEEEKTHKLITYAAQDDRINEPQALCMSFYTHIHTHRAASVQLVRDVLMKDDTEIIV